MDKRKTCGFSPSLPCRYTQLLQLGRERRQKLEESRKKFEFKREINELEHWINDKVLDVLVTLHPSSSLPPSSPSLPSLSGSQESLASAEESIKDLEHAEVLTKKHDDFQKDVAAKEARLDAINTSAQTMIDEGHSESDEIQQLAEVAKGVGSISCDFISTATK